MGISPFSDLEKVLFLQKKNQEVEIWYVYLTGFLNVLFGDLDLSDPFHLLTTPKMWCWGGGFLYFEFVPRRTLFQIFCAKKLKFGTGC